MIEDVEALGSGRWMIFAIDGIANIWDLYMYGFKCTWITWSQDIGSEHHRQKVTIYLLQE